MKAGGTEIKDAEKLSKGDIVQIGHGIHTFIIVSKVAAGQFKVVDSNHWLDETVGYYQRAVALGANTRAFRMGTVGAGTPGPAPAPPPSTFRSGSDVDGNGGVDLVVTTLEPGGGSSAFVAVSTYEAFWQQPRWWSDAGTGWAGITPMVGDVNGDRRADYVFLANAGNDTRAYVARSTGSGYEAPRLWWNGVGYRYNSIKPSFS